MPTKCKPCLSPDVKEAILAGLPELRTMLDDIASCDRPGVIDLCAKKKRAAGPYATFAAACMKRTAGTAPERMQACAKEWQAQKGK